MKACKTENPGLAGVNDTCIIEVTLGDPFGWAATTKKPTPAKKATPAKKLAQTLEVVQPQAAGIDVGSREHWVCVGNDPDNDVRSFGTFTVDLQALADWLKERGVTTVAMESTGVYWIPLYEWLETRGFEVHRLFRSRLPRPPANGKRHPTVASLTKTFILACTDKSRLLMFHLSLAHARRIG